MPPSNTPDLFNSENFNRVVAAYLNYKGPLISVKGPSTHTTTIKFLFAFSTYRMIDIDLRVPSRC